jgi:hypothetical protein
MFNWIYQIFNGTGNINMHENMKGNINYGNSYNGNINGTIDYSNLPYTDESARNTKYTNDISQVMDIQYHDSEEQIRASTDTNLDYYIVYDSSGNPIKYPSTKVQGSTNYYSPGAYTFGSASYVPNYEDSIYLSKLTGLSTTTPIYDMASMQKGFCKYYENQPDKIEQVCNRLNKNGCASTSCCVLLGGSKCVAGNENGPKFKTNYGDVFVKNKDYYYHQEFVHPQHI